VEVSQVIDVTHARTHTRSTSLYALCLIDLKLARLTRDPSHLDSIVDVAGYAACLREVTRV
jgi:hypothetical protein